MTPEPERIEFECEWVVESGIIHPWGPISVLALMKSLIGKRTKVTIEVIE